MTTKQKWGLGIGILAIIVIAYFWNKNSNMKSASGTGLTAEQWKQKWISQYGLTNAEGDAFVKFLKCQQGTGNLYTDAMIAGAFDPNNPSFNAYIVPCGLSSSDLALLNSAALKAAK